MKIHLDWLQDYIEGEIPSAEEIAEKLTMHTCEIETIEKVGDSEVLDIKILPDRGNDLLSHIGMAREVALLFGLKFKDKNYSLPEIQENLVVSPTVDDERCNRYMLQKIEGVEVKESPEWLKNRLEAMGQRSINNIVDITNYVMLSLGQPLHAFDADKIEGEIIVRSGREGESLTTLDGIDVDIDESIVVIADQKDPLVLAGIKGGTKAEVDENTTRILLESAHWDAMYVSKMSRGLKIFTDSAKRFESNISSTIAPEALEMAVSLIAETASSDGLRVGQVTDIYNNKPAKREITLGLNKINRHLGIDISEKEVADIFDKFNFDYIVENGVFKVVAPERRTDLVIPENIIEEIGRIYGYDKLSGKALSGDEVPDKEINKTYRTHQIIRTILQKEGFSEVMTYAFVNKGFVEVANPIASDKAFLRTNLEQKNKESLEKNVRNADLLGLLESVKQFEIGNVFTKEGESTHLAISVEWRKKAKQTEKEYLATVMEKVSGVLGGNLKIVTQEDFFVEVDITDSLVSDELLTDYSEALSAEVRYEPFSVYPFMARDIAVFVPKELESKDVLEVVLEKAGDLCVKNYLFDVYEKDEKVSYAFRLIFQSAEKTLTDEEVTPIVDSIHKTLTDKGWEVR